MTASYLTGFTRLEISSVYKDILELKHKRDIRKIFIVELAVHWIAVSNIVQVC